VRLAAEETAEMSAREWREFWRVRGMRELEALLHAAWRPLTAAPTAADPSFRVASLLGSRASRSAIADEVGRSRRDERRLEPAPEEDARAVARIAAWFEAVAR
jgi:hypothetical protein